MMSKDVSLRWGDNHHYCTSSTSFNTSHFQSTALYFIHIKGFTHTIREHRTIGDTSRVLEVGMEIETDVSSNTFSADNEISNDHTESSQTMDETSEVAEDKVSTETEEILNHLPLEIQTLIVAHLPIKNAVQSSVLSKKFKSIWHSLPFLIFDFQEFPNIEGKDVIFEDFINRTLQQHNPSTVELFKISFGHPLRPFPKINVEWIKFGLDHLVQHLILDGMMKDNQTLPNSLFTTRSLQTLDLSMLGYVLTWPTNAFLPNLAKLKMRGLIFREENITFDFFKTSPSLKELTIWACKFSNVKLVHISAPVEHLVLRNCLINTSKVKLRTAGSIYFYYNNPLASGFDFKGLSPNFIVAVRIHPADHIGRPEEETTRCAVELYTELRNASCLFTSHWFIQYLVKGKALLLNMKPILFNYLTALKVSIRASIEQYKMLIFILSRCPNLASLEIKIFSFSTLTSDELEFHWEDMLQYEMFASLHFLKVANLCGSRGQMGLVEFLLLKAHVVENIKIVPPKITDDLGNSITTFSEINWSAITARVLQFKRASSAQISFE